MRFLNQNKYLLFTEAWLMLGFSRMALLLLPFKRLAGLLGEYVDHQKLQCQYLEESKLPLAVKVSIKRACRFCFWRTMCFEQALAAKFMLKRRSIQNTIYFGVRRDAHTKNMVAHAWLKTGDIIVTGGAINNDFTILSSFKN